MNYEKKYKDLVKKVKELQEANPSDEGIQNWVNENVPELADSKDEKIRKALISAINNICAGDEGLVTFNGFSKEQVLAWLEKQGKHANFRNKIQIGDKVTRNDNGELVNLSQLERVAKKLEKQEEQKPVEEYNITGIGSKNAQGKLGEMIKNLKPVNEVLEQKSAWGEEDEEMLRRCISATFDHGYLRECDWLKSLKDRVGCAIHFTTTSEPVIRENKGNYGGISPNSEWSEEDEENIMMIENRFNDLLEYIREDGSLTKHRKNTLKEDVIGYFNWIKSLKERVQPQPKQEWSEEDKGNLLDVKCIIDEVWNNQDVREEIDHSGEELESLWHWLDNIWQRVEYPQNTWKPSDEQIDAFDSTLQYSQVSHNSFEQLNSLFNDLKKLREE